jgi:hypothetical protein
MLLAVFVGLGVFACFALHAYLADRRERALAVLRAHHEARLVALSMRQAEERRALVVDLDAFRRARRRDGAA